MLPSRGICSVECGEDAAEVDASFAATVNEKDAQVASEVEFIFVKGCQELSKVGVTEGVFTFGIGVVAVPDIKVFGLVSGVGGTRLKTFCSRTCWSGEGSIRLDVVIMAAIVVVVKLVNSWLLRILFMDVGRRLLMDICVASSF